MREPEQHLVQFYASDGFLAESVTRFLAEGLNAGEPAVIIATEAHREVFARELRARDIDVANLVESKRLVMLDADATLAELMAAGMPEPERFERVIGGVLRNLGAATPGKSIRAYGEMVDLLWRRGEQDAAIELEELWNELRGRFEFRLLCAYVIDSFYKQEGILRVCSTHSQMLAPETNPGESDDVSQVVSVVGHQDRGAHRSRARATQGFVASAKSGRCGDRSKARSRRPARERRNTDPSRRRQRTHSLGQSGGAGAARVRSA